MFTVLTDTYNTITFPSPEILYKEKNSKFFGYAFPVTSEEEIKNHFEEMVFDTIIHRNTRLSEAPSVGKPAILYDAESKGSINYLNLAKEVLQRNNMTKISQEERTLTLDNEQHSE